MTVGDPRRASADSPEPGGFDAAVAEDVQPFLWTAPLAIAAAGGLLVAHGSAALETVWSPVTISLTHLATLGFLSAGAFAVVYRLAARVAQEPVPWRPGVRLFHRLFVVSLAAFCGGLAARETALVFAAIGLLFPVLLLFVVPAAIALRRAPPSPTRASLGLALAAFFVAIVLGIWMAHGHGGMRFPGPRPLWIQAHVAIALLGWLGGLAVAVSRDALPTLSGAQALDARVARAIAAALGLALAGPVLVLAVHWWGSWPAALGAPARWISAVTLPAAIAIWIVFPIAGWRASSSRFWRAALGSAPVVALAALATSLSSDPRAGLVFGWLALWGWAGLAVHGGVAWLARSSGLGDVAADSPLPAEGAGLALHLATLALGLVAVATGADPVARLAGVGLLATAGSLAITITQGRGGSVSPSGLGEGPPGRGADAPGTGALG